MKKAILSDWKAKLGALVIAFAIWAVIRQQVDNAIPTIDFELFKSLPEGLPEGGAGGGTSMHIEAEAPALIAWGPQLVVEEPSWILCGEYAQRCYVFRPLKTV